MLTSVAVRCVAASVGTQHSRCSVTGVAAMVLNNSRCSVTGVAAMVLNIQGAQ